jgi:hypothetical protein
MVQQWVKDLVESAKIDVGTPASTLKPGDIVTHPDGRKVKIISGQYWGTHGLSNFFNWKPLLPGCEYFGPQYGPEECGYWSSAHKPELVQRGSR